MAAKKSFRAKEISRARHLGCKAVFSPLGLTSCMLAPGEKFIRWKGESPMVYSSITGNVENRIADQAPPRVNPPIPKPPPPPPPPSNRHRHENIAYQPAPAAEYQGTTQSVSAPPPQRGVFNTLAQASSKYVMYRAHSSKKAYLLSAAIQGAGIALEMANGPHKVDANSEAALEYVIIGDLAGE